ncbi:MAG: GNAT family N-acetyltransferase [Saprospiraceae bacterium]
MDIRPVNPEDLTELFDHIRTTFTNTYSVYNTSENMKRYLLNDLSDLQLINEFENSNSHFYLMKNNNGICGYLKLNRKTAQTEILDCNAVEIERIYVDQSIQRSGLGKEFISFSINKSQEWNSSYLWLGVWSKNENAIGFYKHMGFEIFDTHSFLLGTDTQIDYIMKLTRVEPTSKT